MPVIAPSQIKHADVSSAKVRASGDISSVFTSLENGQVKKLPQIYADIKKAYVQDAEKLKISWIEVKQKLAERIEEISQKGPDIIPVVEFKDLENLAPQTRDEIREKGSVVIKNVIPKDEARSYKHELVDYVDKNPNTKGFPKDKKVVYELYWSKPQIKARTHENMIKTNNFMNNLWHAAPDCEICLDQNVSYADRLRIRQAGDNLFSLGPHADGGSLERWEDKEYGACYSKILSGDWKDYDPYDATHRIEAKQDLHDSSGTCSVFRTFQGWLAVSDIAPKEGTIYFAPAVKEVTAYYMLKPFFDENDNLKLDSDMPGSYPGKSIEFNDKTHPELQLDKLMVPVPPVQPGDAVYWHCDLIHSVDPEHQGKADSSVFYIPSTPLCDSNVRYAQIQRESFINGLVAPDFPGFPNDIGEQEHIDRAIPEDVEGMNRVEALRELCLEKFDIKPQYSEGAKRAVESANSKLFL